MWFELVEFINGHYQTSAQFTQEGAKDLMYDRNQWTIKNYRIFLIWLGKKNAANWLKRTTTWYVDVRGGDPPPFGRVRLRGAAWLDKRRISGLYYGPPLWEFRCFLVSRVIWISSPTRAGSFGSQAALHITTYTFHNSAKCSLFWLMIWCVDLYIT